MSTARLVSAAEWREYLLLRCLGFCCVSEEITPLDQVFIFCSCFLVLHNTWIPNLHCHIWSLCRVIAVLHGTFCIASVMYDHFTNIFSEIKKYSDVCSFPLPTAVSCGSAKFKNTYRLTSCAPSFCWTFALPDVSLWHFFFLQRLLFKLAPSCCTHSLHTFMFSRQTIEGKGNNFRCCPVAEFRLYACRLMCSEWPERLWAGLFVAWLVQVSSNDWLWTACLLMWMGLLWATPFQLGPMKSPVWWSLSAQGLSSQQKGLLFVGTINWWWIIPNPLYSSGQSNGHGCMQTYNTLSRHVCPRLRRRQILHLHVVHCSDSRSFAALGLGGSGSF